MLRQSIWLIAKLKLFGAHIFKSCLCIYIHSFAHSRIRATLAMVVLCRRWKFSDLFVEVLPQTQIPEIKPPQILPQGLLAVFCQQFGGCQGVPGNRGVKLLNGRAFV